MDIRLIIASVYTAGILANPTINHDLKDPSYRSRLIHNALLLADEMIKRAGEIK